MDQLEAHRRAQDTFATVLVKVTPDQLASPTPCSDWDVARIIEHVIGGNQWVQELTGAPPDELPADQPDAHAASAAGAQAVFAAPDGLTRIFTVPFGDLPGAVFVWVRTTDVLAHAWDVARATGQPTDLDPELAGAALTFSHELMQPGLRGEGRPFASEQPCPDDRFVADQLAAFLGRTVD